MCKKSEIFMYFLFLFVKIKGIITIISPFYKSETEGVLLMRRSVMKKICGAAAFLFLFAVSLAAPVSVYAQEETTGSQKIINVVYDDSRSMYLHGETRWCQAKYAMEVFCAMMGEKDVMNIFSMNRSEVLTITGGDGNRVEQVHQMTSMYSGTPFSTVTKAGKALLNEDPAAERWLVILTDGSFDNTEQQTVQRQLDEYNEAGLKTVYLAIGDTAVALQADASRGAFAEKASNTSEILTKVTSIANQIFENQELQGSVVTTDGTVTRLNIDIPTEQIVVFAQGEGASVGSMQLNGTTIAPTAKLPVRHSGDVMPLNDEEITVDTTLNGVVVTYDAGQTPFESGVFSVEVTGAEKVSYYYRPGVDVDCELLYRGQSVREGDELYAGEYEVALHFIDPFSGKQIDSQLLSQAEFSLSVENNGQTQTLEQKSGAVTLAEGQVDIRAVAALPGNVFLTSTRNYKVLPEPMDLKLAFSPEKAEYTPDAMGQDASPVTMTVTDASGAPLSEELIAGAVVTATGGDGLHWEASGGEGGVWELRPVMDAGSFSEMKAGEFEVAVTVESQAGDQYAYGAAAFPFSLMEYSGSALTVNVQKPEEGYSLEDLETAAGIPVEVMVRNPKTGQDEPLTEELEQALELRATSDKRMDWRFEKGEETGQWLMYPAYYNNDPLLSESGTLTVDVVAEATAGEYEYRGEASQTANFEPLSTRTFLELLLPRLAVALGLLWLLIGYIRKKRLHLHGLDPRCLYKRDHSEKVVIRKELLSVLLPYVPQRARVSCHKSAYQCNFPNLRIQADGRWSFRILNKNISLKNTRIGGRLFTTQAELSKHVFNLGSFEIVSLDPATKKPLGKFKFK